MMLERASQWVTALAARVPGQCAVCHGWGDQRVCRPCLQRFAPPVARCQRCAARVPDGTACCGRCLKAPPPFDATLTVADYVFPWNGLIARMKFQAAMDLVPVLAAQLAARHRHTGMPAPDLLLPVPLSMARLRERGYNQSWELARRTARHLDRPAQARVLLRRKDTPHQLALPLHQRAANVRGAFAVDPRWSDTLKGQGIALIDDVMTTGATASEAARILKEAGAASVQVWVVARTPAPADA